MSKHKPDKFDFSNMSERMVFQQQNADGTYTDKITVWAHILRDGFTRQEHDTWFKVLVREQRALGSVLSVGNRLKWKDRMLSIYSWQDPSYEQRGFIEILTKQIVTSIGVTPGPADGDFFSDIVSVFRMTKTSVDRFGIVSYEYSYDFNKPSYMGVKCYFEQDRNKYIDFKKTDVEHDSLVVRFNKDAPIQVEDYIISPVHGKFKVDMVVFDEKDMLLAHVSRSEVQ